MKLLLKYILFTVLGFIVGVLLTYLINDSYNDAQAKAIFYVAAKHYEQGKYDIAAALFNQSLAKNSDDYAPFDLLGDIYNKNGNHKLALEMYRKALEKIDKRNDIEYDRKKIQQVIEKLEELIQGGYD